MAIGIIQEQLSRTYQSNFELTSREKVDSIGVIASSAVWSSLNIKLYFKMQVEI
jgi:hypothetical protein